MVAFVVTITAGVLASLATSEALVRRHILPTDPFDTAREVFHKPGYRVAAFGDSRVNDGVLRTPEIANFAMPGDSLTTVLGKLEVWLAQNPDGLAIVGIPPQQFSLIRLNAQQDDVLADFLSDAEPWLYILRPNYRRYLVSYVQVVIEDPGILWRKPGSGTRDAAASSTFADLSVDQRRNQAQIRSQHHTPVSGFQDLAITTSFQQRLATLFGAGAKLCLVTMPVSGAYQTAVAAEPAFARARDLIGRTAQALEVPYLDLWSSFPDHMFANADHLNKAGAMRATQTILAGCFGNALESGTGTVPSR